VFRQHRDRPVGVLREFEDGREIKQGVIHLESLIQKVRLEPTPSCGDRILSPACLPLPWYWKQVALVLEVCESKACTTRLWYYRILAAWGRCQYCSQFVPNQATFPQTYGDPRNCWRSPSTPDFEG
jgi:hypothetical protein